MKSKFTRVNLKRVSKMESEFISFIDDIDYEGINELIPAKYDKAISTTIKFLEALSYSFDKYAENKYQKDFKFIAPTSKQKMERLENIWDNIVGDDNPQVKYGPEGKASQKPKSIAQAKKTKANKKQ